MKKIYSYFLLCFFFVLSINAQIITTVPEFPMPGESVTLIFDASQGSKGLMGYTGDVYAHTGLMTNDVDWKYAPEWGDNSEKYKLSSLGNDKWELKITPDIRSYYGASAGETIEQMAFVFRSADKSKEGKDIGGKDIFVNVYAEGLSVRIDKPISTISSPGQPIEVHATASTLANLKLFVGDKEVAAKSNAIDISYTLTPETAGNYLITVEAAMNEETVKNTLMLLVMDASAEAPLPTNTKPGINYVSDTEVVLVLQAPGKKAVYVKGDISDWQLLSKYQMKRDDDCFWITLSDLKPGKEYLYQYVIDGAIVIADPYSEKILNPLDQYIPDTTYPDLMAYPTGKTDGSITVIQTKKKAHTWRVTNFKVVDRSNLIIYEMLLRDFTDTSDLNGALGKLDYLKALGATAVELMPCQEFSGNDSWGYNPNFYFAMDKAYGTTDMYKLFIDECHERGLAVILDVVYNQADGDMPYVKMYFDGTNPTKDSPFFNVSAPHPYSVFYDFNHESKLTRGFVKRNLRFLLDEYKIDGFRFDLTKGFTNNPSSESTASNYDQSRIDILKDYNATIKAVKPDALVILEHFCSVTEEEVLAKEGMMLWRNMNGAFCESAKGNAADFSGIYADGNNMPKESLIGFMESHDEERMGFFSTLGITPRLKQLACNAAFSLTVPGPKMIWQFGEMGYDVSINYNGRTGRKPLHWEYLDDSKRQILYETYGKLLNLRLSYPELFSASAALEMKVGTGNWTNRYLQLTNGDKHIVLVGNFGKSASNTAYNFPATGSWYDLMSDVPLTVVSTSQNVALLAHEFRLYTNFKPVLTGIETITPDAQKPIAYYNKESNELIIIGEATSVEIYSVNGMMVQRQENCTSVGLSVLPVGCYMARVHLANGQMQTCKIMK